MTFQTDTYIAEFKQIIEEKLRTRTPVSQLSCGHETSAHTLHQWKHVMLEIQHSDAEWRQENRRMSTENCQSKEDRDILDKTAIWFVKANEAELRA